MKKRVCALLVSLLCVVGMFAATYAVKAKSGLNVRLEANANSEILGKLNKNDAVEVESMDGDWARISYNGTDGYVHSKYLVRVGAKKSRSSGGGFWRWLFSSNGESTWFTAIKWFFALVIGIIIAKIAFAIIISAIGGGLAIGGFSLFFCFLLKWMGIMSADTMWLVSKWGFYAGCVFGLFMFFKNPGEMLSEVFSSSGSSSGSCASSAETSSLSNDYQPEYNEYDKTLEGAGFFGSDLNAKEISCSGDLRDENGQVWERNDDGSYSKKY